MRTMNARNRRYKNQNGEPGSSPFCLFPFAVATPDGVAIGSHRKSGVYTVSKILGPVDSYLISSVR
jgi:hypothetical protein